MPQVILMTKLFIPSRPPCPVPRTSLAGKWLARYQAGGAVTLVCAPAGYGKTTLMLDLMAAAPALPVWLSLDEGDNDVQRFCLYLCTALREAGVPLKGGLDALLQDTGFQSPEAVLSLLIESIAAFGQKLIFVLDDYHMIRSPKVHGLMQFLLAHQPPNLHLALLAREDPPLPLARLRLKETLTELRAEDLAFDREEAALLLAATLETPPPPELLDLITGSTEGWAAGIKLYALALKGRRAADAREYIGKMTGAHAYIIDYLVEEVLASQTEDMRTFLQKTSVLSRMDAALCGAVTERKDGAEMLKEVSRRNLFLNPLDDRREWYRYHALFADSIRTTLSREEEQAVCLTAAAHMKGRGFDLEAVEYAFRSGNMEKALHFVEDSTEEAFRTAQLDTLLTWLSRLPEHMVKSSEILCVRRPIACFITGRPGEAAEYLAALGPGFEKTASPHNRGLVNCLRAMMAGMEGRDAEPFAREALKTLEPFDPISRVSALHTLGRAQFRKGNLSEAAETFRGALDAGLQIGHQFITTLVMMSYSSCLHALGKPGEALAACETYLRGMAGQYGQLPPYAGILYVAMAGFTKTLGDTQKAEALSREGEAMCESISYDAHASMALFAKKPGASAPAEKLSGRELEVLSLICQGLSNGEIAGRLFISANTAQWHISHIYGKLGVKSRTQAVLKARELGLVQ